VTAVGDDMQAIYGFRAADPAHILDFPTRYPRATLIKLERNYRSPQPLLDAGNEIASQATRSFPRRLIAEREGEGRPELVFCLDEQRQASEVCERVLTRREEGALLREQAVLMRAGHHSDLLELELSRRKIPFVKYGGVRYLEAAHVKDFLALLRVATNPSDQLAWFRLLQLLEGVGPVLAGVDGTKGGWVAIVLEDGRFVADRLLLPIETDFAELADAETRETNARAQSRLTLGYFLEG